MRTTRRIGALWTLAAAALASLATVLALPARQRRRHPGRPEQHGGAADQRIRHRRLDAHREPGHVDRLADRLRVPVGALPERRRPPERRRLRRDRGRDDDEVRRRERRRRPSAPCPRDRVERRRLEDRRVERDRSRPRRRRGTAGERAGADPVGDGRAGPDAPRQPRERGAASSRSRSRSAGCGVTRPATTASSSRASRTTRTGCGKATSARRSAPA